VTVVVFRKRSVTVTTMLFLPTSLKGVKKASACTTLMIHDEDSALRCLTVSIASNPFALIQIYQDIERSGSRTILLLLPWQVSLRLLVGATSYRSCSESHGLHITPSAITGNLYHRFQVRSTVVVKIVQLSTREQKSISPGASNRQTILRSFNGL